MIEIACQPNKHIYFASDFHLGLDGKLSSIARERKLVAWLSSIQAQASHLFLLGDVFDFWWEWKGVVPKGYTRFLGKIAEMSDSGIEIYYFTGNHDMWTFGYLEKELGVKVIRKPTAFQMGDKKFWLGHGDGLGPGDKGYKILKKFFTSWILQRMFSMLPPSFGLWLGSTWSGSRQSEKDKYEFYGPEKEWLILYAKEIEARAHYDYYIFGHRHYPLFIPLAGSSAVYCNLGDWYAHFTYGAFENNVLSLRKLE